MDNAFIYLSLADSAARANSMGRSFSWRCVVLCLLTLEGCASSSSFWTRAILATKSQRRALAGWRGGSPGALRLRFHGQQRPLQPADVVSDSDSQPASAKGNQLCVPTTVARPFQGLRSAHVTSALMSASVSDHSFTNGPPGTPSQASKQASKVGWLPFRTHWKMHVS